MLARPLAHFRRHAVGVSHCASRSFVHSFLTALGKEMSPVKNACGLSANLSLKDQKDFTQKQRTDWCQAHVLPCADQDYYPQGHWGFDESGVFETCLCDCIWKKPCDSVGDGIWVRPANEVMCRSLRDGLDLRGLNFLEGDQIYKRRGLIDFCDFNNDQPATLQMGENALEDCGFRDPDPPHMCRYVTYADSNCSQISVKCHVQDSQGKYVPGKWQHAIDTGLVSTLESWTCVGQ